jgi:hypothetical protein
LLVNDQAMSGFFMISARPCLIKPLQQLSAINQQSYAQVLCMVAQAQPSGT